MNHTDLIEVLGANLTDKVKSMYKLFRNCTALSSIKLFDTSNVNNMATMFYGCSSLSSIPLFDTSNVSNMSLMFSDCTSLNSVPLLDTSNAKKVASMFEGCINVQSGALALYQQASSQTNPPSNHYRTFRNCGSNTTTGAAELAQIPSDWKS